MIYETYLGDDDGDDAYDGDDDDDEEDAYVDDDVHAAFDCDYNEILTHRLNLWLPRSISSKKYQLSQ